MIRLMAMILLAALSLDARAAIALVDAESAVTLNAGVPGPSTTLTINTPSGIATDDVMVAQIAVRGASVTITAPSGWSAIESNTAGTALKQVTYWKAASASESSSHTWTFSSSTRGAGGIIAYTGVDPDDPIAASDGQSNSASLTVTAPAVDTVVDDAQVIAFFSSATGNKNLSSAPGGMTERYDEKTGGGAANGVMAAAADANQASAGDTGNKSGTLDSSGGASGVGIGQLIALRPGDGASIDHIRIDHSGSAVTCAPATLTVRACADANCDSVYGSDVDVTLSPGGDSFTIPADSTAGVTRSLSITTPQTVTLGTSAVSPTPNNATRCFVGASETCSLEFADTGFLFSTFATQVAGTSSAGHTLQAVRTDDQTGTCASVFTGTVNIELAGECSNPATCAGRQVAIEGVDIAANPGSGVASYTSVSLDFGADSIASFGFNYPDVGQIILHARYDLGGGGVMAGNSNAFVVQPAGFAISNVMRTADSLPNPEASTASGDVFIGAGQNFSATVTALTSSGATAPNFGQEAAPEGVLLTAALLPGLGLVESPALNNGSLSGFAGGSATASTLSWDEVGIITLTPSIADGSYLGTGDVVGSASDPVGRFAPDHFEVAITDGCTVSAGDDFTYSGQPFTATVFARAADGDPTLNYRDDFARDITLSRDVAGDGSFSGNPLPASAFVAGSGSGSASTIAFSFADMPSLPEDVVIRATDTDNVSSAGHTQGTLSVRSGRLRLLNAFGRATQSMLMPMRIEYWRDFDPPNGMGGWDLASTDTCTALSASDIVTTGVATTASDVDGLDPVGFSAGKGTLQLSAAGAGTSGDTTVTAELGTVAAWLQYDWDGDSGTAAQDPSARATWEINPGNQNQIYRREVIR